MDGAAYSGDQLLRTLGALSNPHRLRIIAALTAGRTYVSELARRLRMNRPLLYMHLQRLEAAGLVHGVLETAADGSSVKYFEVRPFVLTLSPQVIAAAAATLPEEEPSRATTATEAGPSAAPGPGPSAAGPAASKRQEAARE